MRTLKETIVLGEETAAPLLVEVDHSRGTTMVSIGGAPRSMPAEQLERAAAALAQRRAEGNDFRRVCPDHGYYTGASCPRCISLETFRRALDRMLGDASDTMVILLPPWVKP